MRRAVLLLLAALCFCGASAWAQNTSAPPVASNRAWSGPSFREFSGVNGGGPEGQLIGKAITWDRAEIAWSILEPEEGKWNQQPLDELGKRVLAYKAKGANFLPILDYSALWAIDKSAREYSYGNSRWQMRPAADGKVTVIVSTRQADGSWKEASREESPGGDKWPIAANRVGNWENYVRRVVGFLRRAPYNVEYFQIWNEAHPISSFWVGDMDSYMRRIHLPAAKIIREMGGKVVYGGWPVSGPLSEYVALLDKHNAWKSLDVLDVHYFPTSAFQYLRDAAAKRGYRNLPIWQTEFAFTDDPGFVGNTYPRMLHWALTHGWNRRDQYKAFFFAFWSPDDARAYGHGRTFLSGGNLSPHGQSLQTLSNLLEGANLRSYADVETAPRLRPEIDERLSGIETFQVANRIVAAVHLAPNNTAKMFTDWNSTLNSFHLDFAEQPDLTLTLPRINLSRVVSVERVDAAGNRLNLIAKLKAAGNFRGCSVAAPVREDEKSPVKAWNEKTAQAQTFYVVFTLRR